MQTVRDQVLIDSLSAALLRQQISKLFALMVIEDVRNATCPLCGDHISSYQVAVISRGKAQRIDFWHPGIFLPCHLTISEAGA